MLPGGLQEVILKQRAGVRAIYEVEPVRDLGRL